MVLAKMKIRTGGRHLWSRTIGSTVAGELVDSLIFYPLAFLGIWETSQVFKGDAGQCYLLKVTTEVVLTPLTYLVVRLPQASRSTKTITTSARISVRSPAMIKTGVTRGGLAP